MTSQSQILVVRTPTYIFLGDTMYPIVSIYLPCTRIKVIPKMMRTRAWPLRGSVGLGRYYETVQQPSELVIFIPIL